jgi:hypothetical protein
MTAVSSDDNTKHIHIHNVHKMNRFAKIKQVIHNEFLVYQKENIKTRRWEVDISRLRQCLVTDFGLASKTVIMKFS